LVYNGIASGFGKTRSNLAACYAATDVVQAGVSQFAQTRGCMPAAEREMLARSDEVWPALPQAKWSDSCATLQLWMQIVGKVRLALMPAINHTWNVTLYPTIRGVTTAPMPHGTRMLQIDFDFVEHVLSLQTSDGGRRAIPLKPMTVAAFYQQAMAALDALRTPVRIWHMPVEISEPIPFEQDQTHRAYDPEYVQRFWRILLQTT